MGWKDQKVGIYIGLKNLESLAAQAGNREMSLLNLREMRSPPWVLLIRHWILTPVWPQGSWKSYGERRLKKGKLTYLLTCVGGPCVQHPQGLLSDNWLLFLKSHPFPLPGWQLEVMDVVP